MIQKSIQDSYPDESAVCYGCGRHNQEGLHIKTFWDGREGHFRFKPKAYHTAFPGVAYGGLLACLIDCHCVGTAVAAGYQKEGREPGTEPEIAYVTGNLNVSYLRPTPIDAELALRSWVKSYHERKVVVQCEVSAGKTICAKGEVVAVRSKLRVHVKQDG
jgi:acyl-coenzyme A thioesterase PaaI-like protein